MQQRDDIKTNWLFFGLVMVVAIFLRFYRLADLPPGLVDDAAVNGEDAWQLFNRGGHTVFLSGNGGRESMMVYLQAISIAMFGTTPFAVRLPTALVDTFTVALVFWFARWYFKDISSPQTGWVALWAGLWLAVSHWLVAVSRLGFRAVLVPWLAVPLFWTFLLGWRSGKIGWFILAGIFLGLEGYTYSAARILPLVLVLAILPELFPRTEGQRLPVEGSGAETSAGGQVEGQLKGRFRNRAWLLAFGGRLPGLITLMAVAALVYLPMLVYLITHPGQATNRPFSVAIWSFTDTPQALIKVLWENIVLTASFFCCRGNEHLILFGLPGRAAQDIGLGLLLVAGVFWQLKRAGNLEARLLLLWFFLAWIPNLLAIEAPHALRLIGAAPAAALLVATGMSFVARNKPWLAGLLAAWLVAAGGFTFRDYFVRWPALADVPALFNNDLLNQAEAIKTRVAGGEIVYIPRTLYAQPGLHYYLNGSFPPHATGHFVETATSATFLGDADTTAWVRLSSAQAQILPPLTQDARRLLGEWETEATIDPHVLAWEQPGEPITAYIGPARLAGAAFPPVVLSDDVILGDGSLEVTLFWEATTEIKEDYEILIHLLDDAGQGWSIDQMVHSSAYPTSYWRPGLDRVPDYHRLQLNDDLPPGRYRLAVSIFDPLQQVRLPVSDPGAVSLGASPDTIFLGPLKVPLSPPPGQDVTAPDFAANEVFEGVAALRGYNLAGQVLKRGDPLAVELIWQATAGGETDYTVFVHLLDAGGDLVGGHDSQPVNNMYPTGIWSVGERIPDPHTLQTADLPAGEYRLAVGMYERQTGERVPVRGSADGRVVLETKIEIVND